MQSSVEEQRVIIRAHVQTIPGNPQSRPFTLGELFSQEVFYRPLRTEHSADGFDAVHIPPGFDSPNDVKVWFMFDFGVKRDIDRAELVEIPLHVYLAHFDSQKQEW